jgi:hypothetical protein
MQKRTTQQVSAWHGFSLPIKVFVLQEGNFNDSPTAVPFKKDSSTAISLSNRPQITPKVTVTKPSLSVA